LQKNCGRAVIEVNDLRIIVETMQGKKPVFQKLQARKCGSDSWAAAVLFKVRLEKSDGGEKTFN